eukprot:s1_g1225.t1
MIPPERGAVPPVEPEFLAFVQSLPIQDGLLPVWTDWWEGDVLGAVPISLEVKQRFQAEQPRLSPDWFADSFDMPDWSASPRGYLQTSPVFADEARRAKALGWPVVSLTGTHLHPMLAPGETATALIDICRDLGGLANVSVSKIAKRAGVSPGTIYLYFPNKEELIQQTYLDIKTDWFNTMFEAANSSDDSATQIRNMWFALFDFVVAHPNDFLFSETVGAAHLIDAANEASIAKKVRKLEGVMTKAIKDGTLAKAPVTSIQAVLMAPAVQLAKAAARDKKKVKPALLRDTFDIVWRGLAAS